MTVDIAGLVTLLLGGGAVATIGALFRGWVALRSGARAREREMIDDLGRSRDEADERARSERHDADFWRSTAAGYHWQLRRAGIEPAPAEPVPPSQRAA